MDDIRKRDWQVFRRTLLKPPRVLWASFLAFTISYISIDYQRYLIGAVLVTAVLACIAFIAYLESTQKRFHSPRYKQLYEAVMDRTTRMIQAIEQSRRNGQANMTELPRTIRQVSRSLYVALRRADMVAEEVRQSETHAGFTPAHLPNAADPQAQALLQLADKNLTEYRQSLASVWATVERTEAQAMVFVTTMDGLRVRMLGHRLAAKRSDMDSMDFMSTMAEAKMQLSAIDKALEEIELQPFPKVIAVMPTNDESQQVNS